MISENWYSLHQPEKTDSPSLLVFPGRIKENIREMIRIAGNPERLVPHVKTHKMPAVIKLQLEAGISRFKCATIAEVEMLAMSGVKDILLAYQLNKSKALRFIQLIKKYPAVHFSSVVDNEGSAQMLNDLFAKNGLTASVFIDIDNGMHRTGIFVHEDVSGFYQKLDMMSNIHCRGLHVYDGFIHETDFRQRKELVESAFQPVQKIMDYLVASGFPIPEVVAGGSPSFTVHALNPKVFCSPGTCLLWDSGYSRMLPEQHFLHAAVLLTRIISKPVKGRITTDLGHKSVAAENPINKRISFLNLNNYKVISQSEEHLVLEVGEQEWIQCAVGDTLYAIPFHICPTVALYDEVQAVENGEVVGQWEVVARKKKINI